MIDQVDDEIRLVSVKITSALTALVWHVGPYVNSGARVGAAHTLYQVRARGT